MEKEKFISQCLSERGEAPLCLDYREISQHFYDNGYIKEALLLDSCSSEQVGWILCNCRRRSLFRTCKLSICPKCRKLRSWKLFNRFYERLHDFRIARSIYDTGLRFLTLTIRVDENLPDLYDFIKKSFVKFRRAKYVKDRITSGLAVIEVKKSGFNWNVHIHSIIFSKYMDVKNLSLGKKSNLLSAWNKAVGYDANLDIKRILNHKSSLSYIFSYIAKDNFKTKEDVLEYYESLSGKRMFFTFGKKGELYALGFKFKSFCKFCGSSYSWESLEIFDFEVYPQSFKPEKPLNMF